MLAAPLHIGDTIGLISPSHIARRETYAPIIASFQEQGFKVKEADNLYRATDGYLASVRERAADFNQMAADDAVKLVFFGGGEGALDLLPFLDYELVKRRPKLYLSYSDGTSILNALSCGTGLVTYYGQSPSFAFLSGAYNAGQFLSHMVLRDAKEIKKNAPWLSVSPGEGEGVLIGGYTLNFDLLLHSSFFQYDKTAPYLLFLEDHEKFSNEAAVNMYLSYVEQSEFFSNVRGLIFGHYSSERHPALYARLERLGKKHGIPVAYTDDFGHGESHAILPIGARARLTVTPDQEALRFL